MQAYWPPVSRTFLISKNVFQTKTFDKENFVFHIKQLYLVSSYGWYIVLEDLSAWTTKYSK